MYMVALDVSPIDESAFVSTSSADCSRFRSRSTNSQTDDAIADRTPKPKKARPEGRDEVPASGAEGLDRLRVRLARPARDAPRFFGLYYEVGYVGCAVG